MSYKTKYSLNIKEKKEKEFIKINKNLIDYHYNQIQNNYLHSCLNYKGTWYDFEGDMLDYSTKYPNLLFIITTIGEDFPDLWRFFFKNGK